MKHRLKINDRVTVISGSYKGIEGEVLSVDRVKQRVFVRGVALASHFMKKSTSGAGQIVQKEASIHISNVMSVDEYRRRKSKRSASAA